MKGRGSRSANYGSSVALSGDGRTAIVGGDSDSDNGAAWVFVRSGAGWRQQGAKLAAPAPGIDFGSAAALSADGSTALVGADGVDGDSAWIFTRSGSLWTQGPKLSGFPVTVRGRAQDWSDFGHALALTGDGGVALVGADNDSGGTGAAVVFSRNGSGWTRAPARLVPGRPATASRSARASRSPLTARPRSWARPRRTSARGGLVLRPCERHRLERNGPRPAPGRRDELDGRTAA